jgi:Fe-S-cluster-containing dehydrogenase component/DMSO reductase anchor subunit
MKPNANTSQTQSDISTLIDALLIEQQTLTAVERFSLYHDHSGHSSNTKSYHALLPARSPNPGEQYAFEVDLDTCSGCKACVAGCHSLNGLGENETWRDVGHLHGVAEGKPFQQTVTSACHHCVDPGCLNGCPVKAYDKDAATGIVRHLDDQCIGCQYCVMKCPYEVPKYSKNLGIVRKCDMCVNRLAAGEAPACVQSCPNGAIKITLVNQGELKKQFGSNERNNLFLADSPNPQITVPTTRYLSRSKRNGIAFAADHNAPRLDNPHWPLVIMLVFTQAAVGIFLAALFVPVSPILLLAGFALLNAGLAAAPLHLGQPLKAWRVFLGWRTSWLSREILAFNVLAPLAAAVTALAWLPWLKDKFPQVGGWIQKLPSWIPPLDQLQLPLTLGAVTVGLGCVFVSAMVYIDTKRPCWSPKYSLVNFFGATALLGLTFAAFFFVTTNNLRFEWWFTLAALVVRAVLFAWRGMVLRSALKDAQSPVHPNARAVDELLPSAVPLQKWMFVVATVFGLLAVANIAGPAIQWAGMSALATFISEIAARYVFFRAGAGKKMPGGIAA